MFGKSGDTAESCNKQEPSWQPDVTDVYICVFFDGTANNCYEELHKIYHVKMLDQTLFECPKCKQRYFYFTSK